jgi:WD40 repeat protein
MKTKLGPRNSSQYLRFVLLLTILAATLTSHAFATSVINDSATAVTLSSTAHIPGEIHRLTVEKYINAVAWNADGSRLAALSGFGGDITVWETESWTVVKAFHNHGSAYAFNSLAFLSDGSLLTTPPLGDSPDPKYKTLSIFSLVQWNPDTGTPVRYIPDLGSPPSDISTKAANTYAVSKDGSLIAILWAHEVRLYETRTATLARTLPIPPMPKHADIPKSLAFSPDGHELAVGTLFGMMHFFNVQDGTLRKSITAYPDEKYICNAVAYSPNGRLIATGEHKNYNLKDPSTIAVTLWRTSDGTNLASLAGSVVVLQGKEEADPVRTISWSPAGDLLAVGDDASLRLWRVSKTGQKLLLDKKMPHGTNSTSFSPNGMLAATDNNEVVIYQ